MGLIHLCPHDDAEEDADAMSEPLVRRAAAGDATAWDELVDRYGGLVWAVIRGFRLGAADAHDVFQTTWLRLVEHLDDLRNPDAVGGWLATTARRESLAVIRRSGKVVAVDTVHLDVDDDAPPIETRLLDAERDRTLLIAFAKLSDRCQALLRLLTTSPQPSYEVVSEVMDMPVGSIGPTRARCLDALRRKLDASIALA